MPNMDRVPAPATTTAAMSAAPSLAHLSYTRPGDGQTFSALYVRTRTGTKTHIQMTGRASTFCGHWQKATGRLFAVDAARVNPAHVCERCAAAARIEVR